MLVRGVRGALGTRTLSRVTIGCVPLSRLIPVLGVATSVERTSHITGVFGTRRDLLCCPPSDFEYPGSGGIEADPQLDKDLGGDRFPIGE